MFDITLTDNFQYQSQFLSVRVTNWPNIFVDQGQFSDPDFISGTHQRENVQFANNLTYDVEIFDVQFTFNFSSSIVNWCNLQVHQTENEGKYTIYFVAWKSVQPFLDDSASPKNKICYILERSVSFKN